MLFVANAGSSNVAVINTTSLQTLKKIPVSLGHHGKDVSPGGKRVYVSRIGFDQLNVIDAKKLELIKQITVGKGPQGMH